MADDGYNEYLEFYSRNNGKGDLFDSIKENIENKGSCIIPIEFYLIGYKTKEGNYIDGIGVPGANIRVYRTPDLWMHFEKSVRSELDDWITYLNNTYGKTTNGKLGFSLKSFETKEYSIDELIEGIDLPGDNAEEFNGSLIVRFEPRILSAHNYGVEQASYSGIGLVEIFYEAISKSKSSALAHEIGHGIFGYDHHEERGCLMDPKIDSEDLYFCQECNNTLVKLIS